MLSCQGLQLVVKDTSERGLRRMPTEKVLDLICHAILDFGKFLDPFESAASYNIDEIIGSSLWNNSLTVGDFDLATVL